jgi:ATP-binding cassette subfamily B protein
MNRVIRAAKRTGRLVSGNGDPRGAKSRSGKPRSRTEQILKNFHEEATLGKAYDARLIRRLWPFIRPYRATILLSLLVGLIITLGQLLRPLIVQHALDQGVLQHNPEALSQGGLLFAGLVLLEAGLGFVRTYTVQVGGARAMADLRRHVFGFLHKLPMRFFDQQPVGRLVTRVTNDTDAILELFASDALNSITDLLRLVGIIAMMFSLDYELSLIAFAAGPPVALLVIGVRKRAREAFREIRAKTARMNATMGEQVSGMTIVQSYGQQDAAAAEFDEINVAYRDANIRSIKYDSVQDAAIELVSAVCLASVVVSLGYRHTSFGTVFAFAMYLRQFFEPISALAQRYTILQSAMAGAERVFGLLDVSDRDCVPQAAKPPIDSEHAVELDHVSFEYKPGVPVLKDVSVSAKVGEKIALVGATGSGKTTLVSLLLRLYSANQGTIRIFGRDIAGMSREELRQQFSVVPQDVFLFPGTIADNVAAGQKPDRSRVEAVLRRLDAYEWLAVRRGGLDALVEERGENFSAGERQLIAFARALYRDAPILILDEATASVDSLTESRLQRALEELLIGRTALIIAHRLSTIHEADRIITLHQGQVVEQGTHEELIAAGGLYAKLHALQFARVALHPEQTAHAE